MRWARAAYGLRTDSGSGLRLGHNLRPNWVTVKKCSNLLHFCRLGSNLLPNCAARSPGPVVRRDVPGKLTWSLARVGLASLTGLSPGVPWLRALAHARGPQSD